MTLSVFAVVMAAALLHASWNAIVKSAGDKLLATVMVTSTAATLAALSLPFLSSPARASGLFIALSAVFQVAYHGLLAATYEVTDLSQAYPLMRGTAPLLVAAASLFSASDRLSSVAWVGVTGICVGILSMAAAGPLRNRKGVALAILNAFVIAAYTLIDGGGVRRPAAPAAYTLWLFLAGMLLAKPLHPRDHPASRMKGDDAR